MRTLLASLAAVVITATASVATVFVSGGFAVTHTAQTATVDPTIGPAVLLTAADAAADGWTADCSRWGAVYGQVTIYGVKTIEARGCVNPAGVGRGDSFASGRLAALLVNADQPSGE